MNISRLVSSIIGVFFLVLTGCAEKSSPNPDFHIYLCIGQSNMEGNASIEEEDRQNVPDRFKLMATSEFSVPERKIGEWYKGEPPLVRETTGLTPIDYFGRVMLENLPENVSIGVVPVAIGGCRIEHLSKDYDPTTIDQEADWFQGFMSAYDNEPYKRLISCAREAQKDGVIMGILLHQGESNNGDKEWISKVKKIYYDIITDLNLDPDSVPLIAGEVVTTEMGGVCGGMNAIIDSLPSTLNSAYVVRSEGLPQRGDGLHFTAPAYRELGSRYAETMLGIMGVKVK